MTYPDYSAEETCRRGQEIYEQRIRPLVEPSNEGRDVVIDIETGAWEMGDDSIAMCHRLHALHPEAALYHLRAGGEKYMAKIRTPFFPNKKPWPPRPSAE